MEADATILARFVNELPNFPTIGTTRRGYHHMGATICDTILQAGLNYKTVVAPRIVRLSKRWPSARTTSAFLRNIRKYDIYDVLKWRDAEKPRRILEFTEFLAERKLQTEADVASWLQVQGSVDELFGVRGFGPKTVDYLRMLVGESTIPVDRHVRTFVRRAGLLSDDYTQVKSVMHMAAEILSVDPACFDHAVWVFESQKRAFAS